jgi:dihydropteroate synthase
MTCARWKCRDRELPCDRRVLVMGILNVTPDSFSDGGRHAGVEAAVRHAQALEAAGVDLIDIGGESSRPGAEPVSEAEELRRVIPVVEALAPWIKATISVDTTKAAVARAAVGAGARVINDISAGRLDPGLFAVAADTGAGLVLMHMQGQPRTMQADPRYGDVVAEVRAHLEERTAQALAQGVRPEQIAWDPGIGFGKRLAHNVALLRGLPQLAAPGYPLLVGVSRKSFLGQLTGLPVEDRLAPSLAALAFAVQRGARMVRVHDAKESCAAVRVLDSLCADAAEWNTCST